MAEEVITSWSNMVELIDELTATSADARRARRLIRDIPSRFEMRFEVRDGNGTQSCGRLQLFPIPPPRLTPANTNRRKALGYAQGFFRRLNQ